MQLPAAFRGTIGKFKSDTICLGGKRSSKLPNDIEQILDSRIMALDTLLKFG